MEYKSIGQIQQIQGLQSVPKDPDMLTKAAEALKWLNEIDTCIARLRNSLLGDAQAANIAPEPTNLSQYLAAISANAASLAGELATINAKLGTPQAEEYPTARQANEAAARKQDQA